MRGTRRTAGANRTCVVVARLVLLMFKCEQPTHVEMARYCCSTIDPRLRYQQFVHLAESADTCDISIRGHCRVFRCTLTPLSSCAGCWTAGVNVANFSLVTSSETGATHVMVARKSTTNSPRTDLLVEAMIATPKGKGRCPATGARDCHGCSSNSRLIGSQLRRMSPKNEPRPMHM